MAQDHRVDPIALSRTLSHALRHEPWLYELELDDEGWVPLDAMLAALRSEPDFADVTRADIEAMLASATKQRHELDGDRIRALYGHSVPGRILREPATPPAELFHGTCPATVDVILDEGLRPMGRQFVHLSVDRQTAALVGARKAPHPVILRVDAARAIALGATFFRGNDLVWLADAVPADAIAREVPTDAVDE